VDGCRPLGRFTKAQRVTKRAEFRQIQANARRVTTPHFVMLLRRSEPVRSKAQLVESPISGESALASEAARLGVTASRKIGNAVMRNRAKRLVREAFRATRTLWADAIDVVVVVRHFDAQKKLDEVVTEWLNAQDKIERQSRAALSDWVASPPDSPRGRRE
jgi:ribonuclease P protein component